MKSNKLTTYEDLVIVYSIIMKKKKNHLYVMSLNASLNLFSVSLLSLFHIFENSLFNSFLDSFFVIFFDSLFVILFCSLFVTAFVRRLNDCIFANELFERFLRKRLRINDDSKILSSQIVNFYHIMLIYFIVRRH
jgi:hypothetical protein